MILIVSRVKSSPKMCAARRSFLPGREKGGGTPHLAIHPIFPAAYANPTYFTRQTTVGPVHYADESSEELRIETRRSTSYPQ